ncbi:MAG: hypothetical protein QME51_07205 [Planctomycetota bacterium]|nr:hypothetical protein [Planctomycetota bacterium]
MKKVLLVSLALVLITTGVTNLFANSVTTEKNASSAKTLTISGEMDIPMVSRDKGINSVLDGRARGGDSLWSPLLTINLGIDVGDKITGLLQLQNRRLENNVGTAANVDFLGGDNLDPAIKQALVKLEQLVVKELTCTIGLQNVKVTLREGEGAFFLDTAYASPNVVNGFLTEPAWSRNKDTSEFGGLRLDYGSLKNNNYQGVLFMGKIAETPATLTTASQVTTLNGAVVFYKLGDEKIVQGALSQLADAQNGMKVQTISVGGTYKGAVPNLEIYGEFYGQSGKFATRVDQIASAYRVGAKYDIQHQLKPYVDLSYWFLSGGGTTNAKNKNFLSLENVKSTMILEDDVFGLDLDSNYTAIKVESGITTNKVDIDKDGSPEELKVKLLLGLFTLSDQPTSRSGISDGLGTEVDLIVTLQFNPSIGFTLGYATLTGGKFFTHAGTYNAAESSMRMIIFGTNLKF